MKQELYNTYVQILKEELVPAMGCTEPIALAYCASKCRDVLDDEIISIDIYTSGNIIKNVKSVIVPNTNGLKGIEASVVAGIVAGQTSKVLEVIADVTVQQKEEMKRFLKTIPIKIIPIESDSALDICIHLFGKNHQSKVRIAGFHTNIIYISRDDHVIYHSGIIASQDSSLTDRSLLNMESIYEFATKAYAAAGSDARMSGCEMPVIINSGSGNQGMATSLPVIIYAMEENISKEQLYRALVISNLSTIHQKTGIGRLSAYCGAVSAGIGAGCGIAYLKGGDYKTIVHTLVNGLAIVSGIVCDGAKPSCAAKIASSVDAGILGYYMYINGCEFKGGDGIICKGVENTIRNIGRLSREGMKETDKEIIKIMADL